MTVDGDVGDVMEAGDATEVGDVIAVIHAVPVLPAPTHTRAHLYNS